MFEAAAANFTLHAPTEVNTRNSDRGPLLLIMGGEDHTVPEAITKSTMKQYRHTTAVTDLVEFADRGHSLHHRLAMAGSRGILPELAGTLKTLFIGSKVSSRDSAPLGGGL